MNWSRLRWAVPIALTGTFLLGAMLSPPDPFTQVLYAVPLFVVLLPLTYRFGPGIRNAIRRSE